ncbi:MAG: SDR family oxidoreductase [Acidimicrobiia bacterium]|nr:SDR family oxidoreductase [Acidimicrobiia bacterium]
MSVTIINGGTQGLGEAVARKLAAAGADGLVLAGRSADRGESLAAELTAAGTATIFVSADVGDKAAPEAIVDACDARFGRVDGLVNVAAHTTRATIWTDTPEHFDRMFAVNVRAPYFLIQGAARLMVRTGSSGSIVNVGSTDSHGGQPRLSAYSMSKGALATMTRNLAYALMRHDIRVNQVNPGWMDTPSEHRTQREQEGAPENWLELAVPGRPMGRLVEPWEVANTIAFCLSAESGLMTGNCIDIDQSVQGAGRAPMPSVEETPQP